MSRVRAKGKRISRPPIPEAKRQRIEELHRAGTSINGIRKERGIGYGTAWNYVRALEQG
jgi:molybdenum-dependent DNA-binding transcriptional regulator ModE